MHLAADDVADAKVTEFLTQVAAEISLETGLTIDDSDCTEAGAETSEPSQEAD